MGGYRCVHVPVSSPRGGPGVGGVLALAFIVGVAVAAEVYGTWVLWVLLALGVLALAVIIALIVRQAAAPAPAWARGEPTQDAYRAEQAWGREWVAQGAAWQPSRPASVGELDCTPGTVCLGCGTPRAVTTLSISGYLVPVCGSCRTLALNRISSRAYTPPRR